MRCIDVSAGLIAQALTGLIGWRYQPLR